MAHDPWFSVQVAGTKISYQKLGSMFYSVQFSGIRQIWYQNAECMTD